MTKSGLTIYVRSQIRPQSKMMAECGFAKDVALMAAAALAKDCNAKFGDSIDSKLCVAVVKEFIEHRKIGLNCGCCGYRKPNTKLCTLQNSITGDAESCDSFRHLEAFVI